MFVVLTRVRTREFIKYRVKYEASYLSVPNTCSNALSLSILSEQEYLYDTFKQFLHFIE